jgi:hypothetical protein
VAAENCYQELSMLAAYDDGGFKITDILPEEIPFPQHSTQTLLLAEKILARAEERRPEVHWVVIGTGPYSTAFAKSLSRRFPLQSQMRPILVVFPQRLSLRTRSFLPRKDLPL